MIQELVALSKADPVDFLDSRQTSLRIIVIRFVTAMDADRWSIDSIVSAAFMITMMSYKRYCARKCPCFCFEVRLETRVSGWGANKKDWCDYVHVVGLLHHGHEQLYGQPFDRYGTRGNMPKTYDSTGLWCLRPPHMKSRASRVAQTVFEIWNESQHALLPGWWRGYDYQEVRSTDLVGNVLGCMKASILQGRHSLRRSRCNQWQPCHKCQHRWLVATGVRQRDGRVN